MSPPTLIQSLTITNTSITIGYKAGAGIKYGNELQYAVNLYNSSKTKAIAKYGPIEEWDTSKVTDMSSIFTGFKSFNQNIGGWNTSNVEYMDGMFAYTDDFNQNIGSWNTNNVNNMNAMFYHANAFNQNIGSWNTSSVTQMDHMFYTAKSFNQNIGSWNTNNVNNMNAMFYHANAFNQDIGNWNINNVKSTNNYVLFSTKSALSKSYIPKGLQNFNGIFSDSSLRTAVLIYGNDKSAFTGNIKSISNWNTSSVTNMANIFRYATSFNQNISKWNTNNVTNMTYMFYNANAFNQNIKSWNVGKVNTYNGFGIGSFCKSDKTFKNKAHIPTLIKASIACNK